MSESVKRFFRADPAGRILCPAESDRSISILIRKNPQKKVERKKKLDTFECHQSQNPFSSFVGSRPKRDERVNGSCG